MKTLERSEALDRLGVAASLACGVHCVLAPLAMGMAAVLPVEWAFSRASEVTLILLTAALAATSLVPAYRNQHRRKSCLAMFGGGILLLLAAKFALHGASLEPVFLAGGAALIAGAHLANLHFCRSCKKCSHDH
ncbi:MAG: MerC domain-containing protein [Bryobacterales bacterium]